MLRYGSVCSGIESASVAWEPLGMSAAWFSEIEPFPCSVLKHHWPDVVNFGDMTILPKLMRMGLMEAPDVLVGGTPCQAFSVAGKRGSLDDNRGQLTLTYVDLLNAIDEQRVGDECVAVWENVPGVLNTKDNAFGCFLGELSGSGCELQPSGKRWGNAGCVFGPQRAVAWRIIDAQYFGVAQRRRRVFVVASARNGFDPTKILFESESVRRDIAPSRETRKEITSFTSSSFGGYSSGGSETPIIGHRMVAFGEYSDDQTASTMKARDYKDATDLVVQSLTIRGRGCELGSVDLSNTIRASTGGGDKPYVLAHGIPGNWIGRKPENGENATEPMNNISPCQTVTDRHAVHYGSHVRRLTPVECERLQGFPDSHTLLPYGSKQKLDAEMKVYYERQLGRTLTDDEQRSFCGDGPRYKAIGNSKAVPCIQFIGARLLMYQMGYL
jgi:DNA (cytosine-5)-methyltransferase 1